MEKFKLKINEATDSEIDFVSLVKSPAIEKDFHIFSLINKSLFKSKKPKHYSFNDEKMEILGVAMIPDLYIDRLYDDGTVYQVVFDAIEIKKASQIFAKKGYYNNINIEHSDNIADGYFFQSYLTDSSKGIYAPNVIDGYDKLPDGTWILGAKINNKELWNSIKKGDFKGFSVEGLFEVVPKDEEFGGFETGSLLDYVKENENLIEDIYSLIHKSDLMQSYFNSNDKFEFILDLDENELSTFEEYYNIIQFMFGSDFCFKSNKDNVYRVGGIKTHPNCRCKIIDGVYVIDLDDKTCDICIAAEKRYNSRSSNSGAPKSNSFSDFMFDIYVDHKHRKSGGHSRK